MNKILSNSKLSTPSRLVRKVWSRPSSVLKETEETAGNSADVSKISSSQKKGKRKVSTLELEITNLRQQVSILQLTIAKMQEDADQRNKTVSDLANEKQQLSMDLRKEKRSTTSLQKQLLEEREYYYKEKEQYCQEMNDCKKLKKRLKDARKNENDSPQVIELKNQIAKLKEVLQQTLEVNYNLSVKFLRMKNTKVDFKNRLKKQESNHEEAMHDLEKKISNIKIDIANVVDKKFLLPISPSNKKFLQIIKQNGALMHENLCLQIEIDRLTKRMEYFKAIKLQHDLKKRLKCVYSVTHHQKDKKSRDTIKQPQTQRISKSKEPQPKNRNDQESKTSKDEIPQKLKKPKRSKVTGEKASSNTKVIKIYERDKTPGTPKIIILPNSENQNKTSKESKEERGRSNRLEMPAAKSETPSAKHESEVKSTKNNSDTPKGGSVSRSSSQNLNSACTSVSKEVLHTQSAPEIVQTSLYLNSHKPQ